MTTYASPQNDFNFTKLIVVIIAAIAICVLFMKCSPIPKAIQRVEVNEQAFNKVGADWAKLHPCVTDSVIRVSHDTVTISDTSYSGLVSRIPVDSFFTTATTGANQPNAILRGGKNLLGGYADKRNATYAEGNRQTGSGITRTITKTITIHDSVKVVKVDESLAQRLTDSLYSYKMALAGAKGASDTVSGGIKHSRSIWRVIALAALSLLAFIVGAKIYKLVSGKAIFS